MIKLWEALVLAILPCMMAIIAFLQMSGFNRFLLSLMFAMIPFAIFPTLYVGDLIRNRLLARRAARRARR